MAIGERGGEAVDGRARVPTVQAPTCGRSAPQARVGRRVVRIVTGDAAHHAVGLQLFEVLAHGGVADAHEARQVGGGCRGDRLQMFDDALFRSAAGQGHDGRLTEYRKSSLGKCRIQHGFRVVL